MRLSRMTLLLLLPLVLLGGPARAAGTGGIEVDPYPGVVNGHQVTAFHVKVPTRGSHSVRYSLRNTTAGTVHGQLYAASAEPDGRGGWVVGDAGSSPYVRLADQQVSLAAHEIRLGAFTVHGTVHGKKYAAVVVEVRKGAVVSRAATLVYLSRGRVVPLPLLIVLAAVALLALAGLALAVARRRPATPVG